jgi:3-deoxy-D-arabino-heptulosonate 7-phosphate (DAHP) synthase
MSLAAIAAGADGLILEVHPNPDSALCDGSQTITLADLELITGQVRAIHEVLRGVPVVA